MLEWPKTVSEAIEVQERLRALVDLEDTCPEPVPTVTGVDVAYDEVTNRIAAAAVTLDATTFAVLEQRTVIAETSFPYAPGLFAFRELPPLLDALGALTRTPELVVCDGYGIAHPRRFGLASHLGVLTGWPSMGVGKTRFIGDYDEPAAPRGSSSPLIDDGEVIGTVLRTQDGVKPVFVSVGHRIGLGHACRQALALSARFRLPESTRLADGLCRRALKEAKCSS